MVPRPRLQTARRWRPHRLAQWQAAGVPGAGQGGEGVQEFREVAGPAAAVVEEALGAVRAAVVAARVHVPGHDAAATEAAVVRASKGARLLHFAVHAVADRERPLDSALVLAADPAAVDSTGDGSLAELCVSAGDVVAVGQVLARIKG